MGDTSLCKVRKNHQFERDIKYSFKPLLSTMKKKIMILVEVQNPIKGYLKTLLYLLKL